MRCEICSARDSDKHTPQQELYHSLKVLTIDVDLYLPVIDDTDVDATTLREANLTAKEALKRYHNRR